MAVYCKAVQNTEFTVKQHVYGLEHRGFKVLLLTDTRDFCTLHSTLSGGNHSPGVKRQFVMLTNRLILLPMLTMSGAVPPFPHTLSCCVYFTLAFKEGGIRCYHCALRS